MGIKQWEWEWIPIVSVLHKIHIIIMHACECSAVLANKSMLPKLYAVARKVLCVPIHLQLRARGCSALLDAFLRKGRRVWRRVV